MLKKDHPFHTVNGGVYEYFTSMEMDKLVKEVKKVDAQTVVFVLTRPETPFLANMAMDFASILSAEYGDKLVAAKTLEKMDLEPVGTGPFKFVRYEKDSQIRFEAHESYFEGKSKIRSFKPTIYFLLVFFICSVAKNQKKKLIFLIKF
jgi:dipeptide transport system substrate-binding protein